MASSGGGHFCCSDLPACSTTYARQLPATKQTLSQFPVVGEEALPCRCHSLNCTPLVMIDDKDPLQDSTMVGTPKSSISSLLPDNDDPEMTKLATDFQPGPFDVVCARGGEARKHVGNITFRNRIKESASAYAAAESKLFKSLVVSELVKWFRERSTHGGGFVKKVNGCWYEVGDHLAREKVGQALRDQNHSKYKSSTKAKRKRWLQAKQKMVNSDKEIKNMVNANKFILQRMESLEQKRIQAGGDEASDDSILKMFTETNASILKAISTDSNLQNNIKSLVSQEVISGQ